jgi:hypothetical protein
LFSDRLAAHIEAAASVTMREFDLHQWFGREEFERCPGCGENDAIRLTSGASLMCLSCGEVNGRNRRGAGGDEHRADERR